MWLSALSLSLLVEVALLASGTRESIMGLITNDVMCRHVRRRHFTGRNVV